MRTYYARIVGLSPALDGIKVEVVDDDSSLRQVVRLTSSPVSPGMLFIENTCLERVEDIGEEYLALDNPFGKLQEFRTWVDDGLHMTIARYERATNVNVRSDRSGRTLMDHVFWDEKAASAWSMFLDRVGRDGILELIFDLRDMI